MSIVKFLKDNIVDSTSLLVSTLPLYQSLEIMAGVSDDVSLKSRLIVTGLTYLGVGTVIKKGRDFSNNLFNIADGTPEYLKMAHDSGYMFGVNIPLGLALYYGAGERDWDTIWRGVLYTSVMGAAIGSYIGAALDVGSDLAGQKECHRPWYPNKLRLASKKVKRGVAAGLIATSIASVASIYAISEDEFDFLSSKASYDVLEEKVLKE